MLPFVWLSWPDQTKGMYGDILSSGVEVEMHLVDFALSGVLRYSSGAKFLRHESAPSLTNFSIVPQKHVIQTLCRLEDIRG